MIDRPSYFNRIATAVNRSPVTALLGPRQCGKTTLSRMFGDKHNANYFDLELPSDQQRLQNPELMLGSLKGIVILDEIQIKPELFNILRVLVDRPQSQLRFLVLGSASPHIVKNVSESLAGRVELIELAGFDLLETGVESFEKLWIRGGFPRSYLSDLEDESLAWRNSFIRTFLERDIPMLGITIPATAMHRFWTMLAHSHGQIWNASGLSRSMGLSDKTVRSYLDILTGTFMIRQLQPWYENIRKRQVKSPKIYLRDSGLLHSLLSLPDLHYLLGHPCLGASWEGFALEQVLMLIRPSEAYFWRTHSGAEIDLLFFQGGKGYGIEFKYSETPTVTKSMHAALNDLALKHLWIVYPGKYEYPVHEKITALPLTKISLLRACQK